MTDPFATQDVWYRLLNCRFRLPAGARTQAMANFASLRGRAALNRVYVKTQMPLDYRRFQAASAHGGYNTVEEKAAVLRVLADTRAEFQERAAR
ncbi:MAG: hypothetical protein ACREX4_16390 [Gammaproteobacteria bacterium]